MAGLAMGIGFASMGTAAIIAGAAGQCLTSPILSLGCNQESEFYASDTKVTEIVSTYFYNLQTKIDQNDEIVQIQNVLAKNTENCSFTADQSANITIDFKADIKDQIATETNIAITNLLTQKVNNIFDSKNEMFSTLTNQTTKSKLIADVTNAVNSTFNITTMKNIYKRLYGFQQQTIILRDIKCPQNDSRIIVNQEFILKLYSNVMTVTLLDNLMKIDVLNDSYQEALNKLKQENKGLNSIIDSIMSFFKTWAIVIGIIIIAAIIGFVMFTKAGGLTQLKDLQEASKYYYF